MLDAHLQIVAHNFTKIMSLPLAKVEPLGGISNFVFRVTASTGQQYIFKILVSEKSDPLKKQEKECLEYIFQIYNRPIFESQHHRIELCITTAELPLAHFLDPAHACLLLKSVARFNSLHALPRAQPNLFHILDQDGPFIRDSIALKLKGVSDADRTLFEGQLARLDRALGVLRQEFSFPEVVLCHNDLFYRNLIWDEKRQGYQLIDFEYVGYNPKGMDVFQFVNEWLIDYDVPAAPYFRLAMENYPSEERVREMVRFYLFWFAHGRRFDGRPETPALLDEVWATPEFAAVDEGEVERIAGLFPYFGVLTNALWFYWALMIMHLDGMNFDHVQFAKTKFWMVEWFAERLGRESVSAALAAK